MKSGTSWIVNLVSIAAQLANGAGALPLPPKAQPWVAVIFGIVQLVGSRIAHNSNPDGTPATVAFVPAGAPPKSFSAGAGH